MPEDVSTSRTGIKQNNVVHDLDRWLDTSNAHRDGPSRKLNTSVREVTAEQTLHRIKPLLGEFGIRQVIDLTLEGVSACPVFQVIRDDTRSQYFNAGKGFTKVESVVSGLMEAIEVHCFERADPSLLFSSKELTLTGKHRATVLAATPGCASDTALPIATEHHRFVLGMDHRDNAEVLLPAHHVFRELDGMGVTLASPNGVASGNSVPEALCHALGEMLERHALAGFYQHGSSGNHVFYQQLERVSPPPDAENIHLCLEQLRKKDIAADFIFISAEAGVAVFICFLDVLTGSGTRGAVQGFGAHPDPKIAMARALGEAVQILALCPLSSAENAMSRDDAERVVMTSKQAAAIDSSLILSQRLADHVFLQKLKSRLELIDYEYMAFHDVAGTDQEEGAAGTNSNASTHQALQRLLQGLEKMGHGTVYSCVISPPSLPVVVVKCFCPGLDCIRGI